MNLYLKRKFLSAVDRFTVYDEAGNKRYTVKGSLWSASRRFCIYDLAGIECAVVHPKELSSPPCYKMSRGGVEIGDITRERNLFPQTYTVRGLAWRAVQKMGEFGEDECEFTDGTRTVVVVSSQCRRYSYEIRIAPDVNELDALMVALVFDGLQKSL